MLLSLARQNYRTVALATCTFLQTSTIFWRKCVFYTTLVTQGSIIIARRVQCMVEEREMIEAASETDEVSALGAG